MISAFFDGLCLFGGAFPYVGAFLIQQFGLSLGIAGLVVAGFGLGAFVYTGAARHLVRHVVAPWVGVGCCCSADADCSASDGVG